MAPAPGPARRGRAVHLDRVVPGRRPAKRSGPVPSRRVAVQPPPGSRRSTTWSRRMAGSPATTRPAIAPSRQNRKSAVASQPGRIATVATAVLAAGASALARLTVRVPDGTPEGGYHCAAAYRLESPTSAPGVGLRAAVRVAAAVYRVVGEPPVAGPQGAELELEGTGAVHAPGSR